MQILFPQNQELMLLKRANLEIGLKNRGYGVHTFKDPVDALNYLKKDPSDLGVNIFPLRELTNGEERVFQSLLT